MCRGSDVAANCNIGSTEADQPSQHSATGSDNSERPRLPPENRRENIKLSRTRKRSTAFSSLLHTCGLQTVTKLDIKFPRPLERRYTMNPPSAKAKPAGDRPSASGPSIIMDAGLAAVHDWSSILEAKWALKGDKRDPCFVLKRSGPYSISLQLPVKYLQVIFLTHNLIIGRHCRCRKYFR